MTEIRVVADQDQYVVVLEWIDGGLTVHGPYDIQEAASAAAVELYRAHRQLYQARSQRLKPPIWTEGAAEMHLLHRGQVDEDQDSAPEPDAGG